MRKFITYLCLAIVLLSAGSMLSLSSRSALPTIPNESALGRVKRVLGIWRTNIFIMADQNVEYSNVVANGILTVTGLSTLNGSLLVNGTATLNGNLQANMGLATFTNNLTVDNDLVVENDLVVTNATTLVGTLTQEGAATFTNNGTFNLGVFMASGAIAVTNNQTLAANEILVSVLELDSGGGIANATNSVSLPDPLVVGKLLVVIVDAASTNNVLLPNSDANIENQSDIIIEDGGEAGVLLYATATNRWRSIQ